MHRETETDRPNRPCHPCPAHRAFTLVELLVVVAIIALLVAILLPSLDLAKSLARNSKCMSNLHSWGLATHMFAAENNGRTPIPGEPLFGEWSPAGPSYTARADGDSASKPIGYWDDSRLWVNALAEYANAEPYWKLQERHMDGGAKLPYAGDESLFVCPEAREPIGDTDRLDSDGYFLIYGYPPGSSGIYDPNGSQIIAAPGGAEARPAFISYAWNSKATRSARVIQIDNLNQPAADVLMEDKRTRNEEVTPEVNRAYQVATGRAPDAPGGRLLGRSLARIKGDWQRFTTRHPGEGGNLMFADGHVDGYSYLELIEDPTWAFGTGIADFNLPEVRWNPFGRAQEN